MRRLLNSTKSSCLIRIRESGRWGQKLDDKERSGSNWLDRNYSWQITCCLFHDWSVFRIRDEKSGHLRSENGRHAFGTPCYVWFGSNWLDRDQKLEKVDIVSAIDQCSGSNSRNVHWLEYEWDNHDLQILKKDSRSSWLNTSFQTVNEMRSSTKWSQFLMKRSGCEDSG